MNKKIIIYLVSFFLIGCETKDKTMNYPIIASVFDNDVIVLKEKIVEFKKDINIRANSGNTALHYAVNAHKTKISEYELIQNNLLDSHTSNPLIILTLLNACADPNIQDSLGATPIAYAVFHNDLTSTYLLMLFGAEVEFAKKIAKTRKYLEMIQLLETSFIQKEGVNCM